MSLLARFSNSRDVVLPLLKPVVITAAATEPLGNPVVLARQGGRATTLWFGTTVPPIIPQNEASLPLLVRTLPRNNTQALKDTWYCFY